MAYGNSKALTFRHAASLRPREDRVRVDVHQRYVETTNRTKATKRAAPVRHRHGAGPGAHLRAVGDDAQDRQRERGQDTNKHGITKHIKQAAENIGAITLNRFS